MKDKTSPSTDLSELTLNQLEDTLFRDSTIEVTERVSETDPMEALQALVSSQEAEAADASAEAEVAEQQEVDVSAEPQEAAAPEPVAPVTPSRIEEYLGQNQELLQYLADQKKSQLSATQAQNEQAATSDEAVAEAIRQAGLNPADPMHQFAYRQSMETSMMEQQMAELHQRLVKYEKQAYITNAQNELSPKIDDTLRSYGELPDTTVSTIKSNAASAMAHGYEQQQAIDMAIQPYLDLLRHMKTLGTATPSAPANNEPPKKTRDEKSLLAASLTGRSTGHGKTIENLSIDDIEKALFR